MIPAKPSQTSQQIATQQDRPRLRDCIQPWLNSNSWDMDRQEPVWTCPRTLTSSQAEHLQAVKTAHAERFQPALSDWVMIRVAAMMSLYWQDPGDAESEKRRLAIWAKHLSDFPKALIERGISKWEKTQTRRPTPADIRALADQSGGEEWRLWRRIQEASALPVSKADDRDEKPTEATPEQRAEALRVLAETVAKLKDEHKTERQKVRDHKTPEADPADVARRRAVLDRLADTAEMAPPVPGRPRQDEEYDF